ncbi:MAG: SDR family NAD(P)-dependent oxidoreductase [Leptospiraceae bacterium]
MKLQGNTILITGGGSGIGLALAQEFRNRGNTVLIANRSEAKLKNAADLGFSTYRMDMTDPGEIQSVGQKILADFPELNGIVHNAGIMKSESLVSGPSSEIQMETVAINLLGPMLLNNVLIPHFVQRPSAMIMTVTSGLAFIPLAMYPGYCASKAGLHSYTESLRYQLKDTQVRVVELAPPYVQTELTGEAQAKDPMAMPLEEFIAEVMQQIEKNPDSKEILVERVQPLRFASEKGHAEYQKFFDEFNQSMTAARGGVF